nr:reverse transcriptase domain-containing protein [Tanacetum cinerariifolium]
MQGKGRNDKQRYSSFKIKEIRKKEGDSKSLITVDTLVDWTDHDGESDGVVTSKEFAWVLQSIKDLLRLSEADGPIWQGFLRLMLETCLLVFFPKEALKAQPRRDSSRVVLSFTSFFFLYISSVVIVTVLPDCSSSFLVVALSGSFLFLLFNSSANFWQWHLKSSGSGNALCILFPINASTFGVSPDVVELKDMVKALLLDKIGQNQSHAPVKEVEESCVTCGGAYSYRNCPATDGNVYRNNIQELVSQASAVNYNQGNTTYQAPAYQALAPQTQGVSKEDFSAYVKANDPVMKNMQSQGQNMQNQLTNLTNLITKFVNSNSASTSSLGTLPSNTIANPKSDLKAITTQSGVSYDRPQIPPSVVENELEVTKDTVNHTNNGNTKDVYPWAVQSESPVLIFKPVIAPVSASKPNPKALIPYPSRRNNERNRMAECLALADLGGSINLMPFSVWKRLSLPDLTPTCMNLELADHSISHPVGVAVDVYVKTGRVLIDLFEGELTLRFGKEAITFNLDQTSKYSVNYSDMMAKRIDVIDMACEEYSQEVLEGDILLLEAFLNDDPSFPPLNQRNYLPEVRKELKIYEAKSNKSSVDEHPVVELKALPPFPEYAFLEGDDKLPVIFAKDLSVEENTALITILKSHKRAIAWKISMKKSKFMVKEGIVLGHKISKQGTEVDKAKVDVISKLPLPTTVKGIRSILGHASFYRRSIKDFSKIAKPMTRLLEKDIPFIFSQECVDAFQTLKRKLTEAPILIAPNWDIPFELMCNASDFAIEAVLGQRQDKHFRPIHYVSKTMTEA